MAVVSMRELLEAGVHFGHQTRRWNPKMRRYIFTERGGIYIIDLEQTLELLEQAYAFARNVAERRGTILFVGTKKQAQDAVSEQARRVGMPYVNNRWLGGLLTNWRTISSRIERLHELRRLKEEGQLELLPAKERLAMLAELEKLEANLGGVADMRRQPDAIFIIDLRKEQLAVREAQRLGLPVLALVDTNCDPEEADYVIPGNDDAIRSCNLIVRVVADGIMAGKSEVTVDEMERPVEVAEADGAGEEQPEQRVDDAGNIERGGGIGTVSEIAADLVKDLREQTGAGMMDCKRALEEANGDIEAARKILREKGMAQAGKRASRVTNEGVVLQSIEGGVATMVAVACETEPVSANESFRAFASSVLEAVESKGPGAVEALEEARVELVAKIGENIVIRDVERLEAGEDAVLAGYVHPPANKIGVLVELSGGDAELGRLLAMHVSFANPRFLVREEVPADLVADERDVYMKQPDVVSKPEQVREKIVEGMLNKRFFAEQVLSEQPWIHDSDKTVGKVLGEHGAKVVAIRRFALSE